MYHQYILNNTKDSNSDIIHMSSVDINNKNLSLSLSLNETLNEKNNEREIKQKHYPPSNKEWFNCVYNYNKNYTQNLAVKNINTYKIFNGYFNMKSKTGSFLKRTFLNSTTKASDSQLSEYIEWNTNENSSSYFSIVKKQTLKRKRNLTKKIKNRILRKKKFSVKKTFISKVENKHLNYKIISTISLYNREKSILQKKIYKIFKRLFFTGFVWWPKSIPKKNEKKNNNKNIHNKIYYRLKRIYKLKDLLVRISNERNIPKYWEIKNKMSIRDILRKSLVSKANNRNMYCYAQSKSLVSHYIKSRKEIKINRFIHKKYKNLLLYKYYMLMLCFFKYKFNNNNLLGLRNIMSKLYNKKSIFKLISLKYFYLDSNIVASVITKKLKDRKKKVFIILKRALSKVKKLKYLNIWKGQLDLNSLVSVFEDETKILSIKVAENLSHSLAQNDQIDNMVYLKDFLYRSKKDIASVILGNIKHKILYGIRLQSAGRLTKRLTALRSISKVNYKGSLKNIDSSVLGLSTILLRGNLKSNLQYTNINSYNRNGSNSTKSSIASI